MRNDVLVVEISGKRPGGSDKRPTEKYQIAHDHLIISNNADGYITNWPIVMVPDDFKEDYISRYKTSESAWYAPMNRSYAITYAKEKGYKYLVQLDDNILKLEIAYLIKSADVIKRYRSTFSYEMMDDFIEMLVCVLENTDAGMAGCGLMGVSAPDKTFLSERYVYSLFALDLSRCPDHFQGDFEDDIEFRLKLGQMGVPAVQVAPLRYDKTSQFSGKDESGNRAAYTKAGTARGEHMRALYGDKYSCGMRGKTAGIKCEKKNGKAYFQHRLTPWKVGVKVKNREAIEEKFKRLLEKYAPYTPDKYVIKEKKVKKDAHRQTT